MQTAASELLLPLAGAALLLRLVLGQRGRGHRQEGQEEEEGEEAEEEEEEEGVFSSSSHNRLTVTHSRTEQKLFIEPPFGSLA